MNVIEQYCLQNFNSIILSKTNLSGLGKIPKIGSISLFFIINLKQYKKNMLLFYIIINLLFGGIFFLKTNIRQSLYIINVVLKQKKILIFLQSFVSFYLPVLSFMDNTVKMGLVHSKSNFARSLTYRFNYFVFPVIPEADSLCENYELIYNFISNYKMQMDVSISNGLQSKSCNSFLLRMYRLPCKFEKKEL